MRASIVAGVLLAAAVALVIVVSSGLELDVESYAVTGVLGGGVLGLVADRAPWERLGGFVVGFVAIWVGYVLRAAVMPDTTSGVVVATVVSLAICVVAYALGRDHLPLWSLLLGAGLFAGAYESAFTAAVAEVGTTSVDAATALLLTIAVGFTVATLVMAGRADATGRDSKPIAEPDDDHPNTLTLDEALNREVAR